MSEPLDAPLHDPLDGEPMEGNADEAAAAFGDFDDEPPPGWGSSEPEAEEGIGGPTLPGDALDDVDIPPARASRGGRQASPLPGEGGHGAVPSLVPPQGTSEFEAVERIQVERGPDGPGIHALPAMRQMEEGLRFIALATAPSRHFLPDGLGAELLRRTGQTLAPVHPGAAQRQDPHDAAKRPPEVGVEPPTAVSKDPILPPRFSLDEVDDLLPEAPRPQMAADAEVPKASVPVPEPVHSHVQEPTPGHGPTGAASTKAPDGPEAGAGLRYHRGPLQDASGVGEAARKGPVEAPVAEQKPKRDGGPSPFRFGHLAAAGALVGLLGWAIGRSSGSRAGQDPVVVYALGERAQAMAYLGMQIKELELALAEKDRALSESAQGLGTAPNRIQLAQVEALGRERNHLAISLGALRRRRAHLVGGGNG